MTYIRIQSGTLFIASFNCVVFVVYLFFFPSAFEAVKQFLSKPQYAVFNQLVFLRNLDFIPHCGDVFIFNLYIHFFTFLVEFYLYYRGMIRYSEFVWPLNARRVLPKVIIMVAVSLSLTHQFATGQDVMCAEYPGQIFSWTIFDVGSLYLRGLGVIFPLRFVSLFFPNPGPFVQMATDRNPNL